VNIIGLGNAGVKIASCFSKFPQYNCISIDTDKNSDITIKRRRTHEEYDSNFPDVKRRLKLTADPILVVTCGAGTVSGGILRLLEQLQERSVSVLYVYPDIALLSEIKKTQEKIVRNVLQQYARSGKLDMFYLVDNLRLEEGIGEVPILGYFDVLNQGIVNTFHMINVFRHSDAVIGNFVEPTEISRISTIGILDLEKDEEKWFFDLHSPRDVVYYYGINEEELKTDGTLFKKITEFVKSKLEDKINISYGVYKTGYEQRYCYCIKYSSVVQSHLDGQDIG
tara:strand:+ start:60 stop:902 length:843 start_codon:yes stop_codon:yes gene_type:complete